MTYFVKKVLLLASIVSACNVSVCSPSFKSDLAVVTACITGLAIAFPTLYIYGKHDAISSAKRSAAQCSERYKSFQDGTASEEFIRHVHELVRLLPLTSLMSWQQKRLPYAVAQDDGIKTFPMYRFLAFIENDLYELQCAKTRLSGFVEASDDCLNDLSQLISKLEGIRLVTIASEAYAQEVAKLTELGNDVVLQGTKSSSFSGIGKNILALCSGFFIGTGITVLLASKVAKLLFSDKRHHKYDFIKLLEADYEYSLDRGIAAYYKNPRQEVHGFAEYIFDALSDPQLYFKNADDRQRALGTDIFRRMLIQIL